MSTANGVAARSGNTHPEVTEQAEKDAKRAAAKAQSDAKALDARLVKTLETIEGNLSKLAELIAAAKETEVWRLVTDQDGKPFPSWQAYLSDRLSAQPKLHKIVRDPVIKMLVEEGMSIRAAAKATGASVGTAHNAVNGEKDTRAARPGGDTSGVAGTKSATASKVCVQILNATKRGRDVIADMSDLELEKLNADLTESVNVVRGMIKLRKQIADRQRQQETQPQPQPAKSAA